MKKKTPKKIAQLREAEEAKHIIDMFDPDDEFASEPLTLAKISKDLKKKVADMSLNEIRFLVDIFYQYQKKRIHLESQIRALVQGFDTASKKTPKDHDSVLGWLHNHLTELEKQLEATLAFFSNRHPICVWAREFTGVGPIISAGLVGHLRIEQAPAAGHFWNFAGLNPESIWEEGQKRPWNARLKTLCYKMGESFVKAQHLIPEDELDIPLYEHARWARKTYYSHHFMLRKAFEVDRNSKGYFTPEAERRAALSPNQGGYGPTTDAWEWVNGCYPAGTPNKLQAFVAEQNAITKQAKEDLKAAMTATDKAGIKAETKANKKIIDKMVADATVARTEWLKAHKVAPGQGLPMIPPAHVHAIARRWVVKLFLSDLHKHWFKETYGYEPPAPYAIAILEHAHEFKLPA